MRNLILFAVAFAVVLTEADVDQLGFDVTESDFKAHFGIPEETTQEDGFVKNTNFSLEDLSVYMTEEELANFTTPVETEAPTAEEVPATEAPVAEAAPKQTAKEKADAKAAKAEETKAAKAAEKAKKEADKAAQATEPKKPGVIASILEIIQTSATPVNEAQITDALHLRFPDKQKASLGNTVKAQIGGKAQPLRMEQEKAVTFKIDEVVLEEGKKAVRHYSVVPNAAK